MWPFDAALEREVVRLRAHIQDLTDLQLKEREAMIAERKELLDRILALTAPAALRESRRPPGETVTTSPMSQGSAPRTVAFSWPGFRRDTRPPDPDKES